MTRWGRLGVALATIGVAGIFVVCALGNPLGAVLRLIDKKHGHRDEEILN